jgi:hypothetical protein
MAGNFVYGISTFERRRGDFPQLPVVNMLGENIPVEPGVTLQSRPGLEESDVVMGNGPVRELYQIDGVLNNGLFGVSGNKLYNGSTEIGTVDGDDNVSFAGYEDYVFVNAGEKIYTYDGTTFSQIIFPDDADVSKIAVGASRLIALRKDTGTFYWSEPLGVTIPSLNFATAENVPDKLLDLLFIADRLILFGSETVETWPVAGDQDLPFQPLPGATFPVGIKAVGCATVFGRSFAWITNYNEVCVGTPENIISDPELQVRLSATENPHLWVFFVDDNEFLAVTMDNETWVYGLRTQLWSTLKSYGKDNWVCQCYENGLFGATDRGELVQWSDDYSDFGEILERSFNGWITLTGEPLWLANIVLRTNPGTTPFLSGEYSDPVVELRTSQDGGKTWQPWQSQSLGRQGTYRAKTVWSSMGQFGYPGVLVQVRNSDPVPFRISGLSYNEPFGGI